jgi:transposase-like protein
MSTTHGNDIEVTAALLCPDCGSSELAKNGKTSAGLQKMKCLDGRNKGCRRQFVVGSDYMVHPLIKHIVKNLLAGEIKPKAIHQAVPWISIRWIYELRRKAR